MARRIYVSTRIPGTPVSVGRGVSSKPGVQLSDGTKLWMIIWAVVFVISAVTVPPLAGAWFIVGLLSAIPCAITSLRAEKRRKAGDTRTPEQRVESFNERVRASNKQLDATNASRQAANDDRRMAWAADRRARGKYVNDKMLAKVEARVSARSVVAASTHITAQDRAWLIEHGWTPPA
jgi:hypothetical protein